MKPAAASHFPVTPFERSGLAFGFVHRRFACGTLQANGRSRQSARGVDLAVVSVLESDLFPSSYNSNPIASPACGGLPSNGVIESARRVTTFRSRSQSCRGASDATLTFIVHRLVSELSLIRTEEAPTRQLSVLRHPADVDYNLAHPDRESDRKLMTCSRNGVIRQR